jgi:shikimate kinase
MTNDSSIGFIGYRGSGKTTVGRLLAGQLGRNFVDIDEQVVRLAGKTIKEIFEQTGEQAFRDLESRCIVEAVGIQQAVISFGGGALDREENRDVVKAARLTLIYLRCEPGELLRRIRSDPLTAATRPNLTALGGGIDEIQSVLARREPLWRAMTAGEVNVTDQSAEQVAAWCMENL